MIACCSLSHRNIIDIRLHIFRVKRVLWCASVTYTQVGYLTSVYQLWDYLLIPGSIFLQANLRLLLIFTIFSFRKEFFEAQATSYAPTRNTSLMFCLMEEAHDVSSYRNHWPQSKWNPQEYSQRMYPLSHWPYGGHRRCTCVFPLVRNCWL